MKYWISITFYLWKNIWNRWFESPLSALSKVILTFLLAVLAFSIVGALRQTEKVLEEKLGEQDILTAVITPSPSEGKGEVYLRNSLHREATIKRFTQGEVTIDYVRRSYYTAEAEDNMRLPIVTFWAEPSFWEESYGDFSRPENYLFSHQDIPPQTATINSIPFSLTRIPFPKVIDNVKGQSDIICLPYTRGELLLRNGFTEYLLIQAHSVDSLKTALSKIEAYLLAERMRYTLTSSMSILSELLKFMDIQQYVRLILLSLLIIIIAIVLGNQAFLEFREQQYHFALLRSFGVPHFLITVMDLIEKILLSGTGFMLAAYLLPMGIRLTKEKMASSDTLNILLEREDYYFIGGGIFIGILLSWLFISITSKKQVGLVLS